MDFIFIILYTHKYYEDTQLTLMCLQTLLRDIITQQLHTLISSKVYVGVHNRKYA